MTNENDRTGSDKASWIDGARDIGLLLSPGQISQFGRLQTELLDWNKRMNLTAITDPAAVQSRHFLDSLSIVASLVGNLPISDFAGRILDVGSGGGIPGVPLAIVLPRAPVTLLEATQKKCRFLEHAIAVLDLTNTSVACGRAEDLAHQPALRETFDVVVVRAVARLPTLVELCLPFLRVGGRLIAMKKVGIDAEIDTANSVAALVGGRPLTPVVVRIPNLGEDRLLVTFEKSEQTPRQYPRRAGLPGKSPLAASPKSRNH